MSIIFCKHEEKIYVTSACDPDCLSDKIDLIFSNTRVLTGHANWVTQILIFHSECIFLVSHEKFKALPTPIVQQKIALWIFPQKFSNLITSRRRVML